MKKIGTCLWMTDKGEEAAKCYTSLFKNSKVVQTVNYTPYSAEVSGQKIGTPMTVDCEVAGLEIMTLNAGPIFKLNPSISYFVYCDTEDEADRLWKELSGGGSVLMGYDRYPFAKKFGWCADKWGTSWQISFGNPPSAQQIVPSLMFFGRNFGKGQEAIDFYTGLFPNSKTEFVAKDDKTNTVQFGTFTLNGTKFMIAENNAPHQFEFNNAFSFMVVCEDQAEIDKYWTALSAGGSAEPCGWVKDKYGVSWQVVTPELVEWGKNAEKFDAMFKVLTAMKKPELQKLRDAYNNG